MLLDAWLVIFALYLMDWEDGGYLPDLESVADKSRVVMNDTARYLLEAYRLFRLDAMRDDTIYGRENRALIEKFEETLYVDYDEHGTRIHDRNENVGAVLQFLMRDEYPFVTQHLGQRFFWSVYRAIGLPVTDFSDYLKGYDVSLRHFLSKKRMTPELEDIRRSIVISIPTITFHTLNTINVEPDLEYGFFEPVKEESRMDRENEFEE